MSSSLLSERDKMLCWMSDVLNQMARVGKEPTEGAVLKACIGFRDIFCKSMTLDDLSRLFYTMRATTMADFPKIKEFHKKLMMERMNQAPHN